MGNEQLYLVTNLTCTCSLHVEIQHLDDEDYGEEASVQATYSVLHRLRVLFRRR